MTLLIHIRCIGESRGQCVFYTSTEMFSVSECKLFPIKHFL